MVEYDGKFYCQECQKKVPAEYNVQLNSYWCHYEIKTKNGYEDYEEIGDRDYNSTDENFFFCKEHYNAYCNNELEGY